MREEIKDLKGVSGVYIVRFSENFDYIYHYIDVDGIDWDINGSTENPNYIGETKDLHKRLTAHIGNMDLSNRGCQSRGHQIERQGFEQFGEYTIEIYLAPEEELNYYENFMVWLNGSFSISKYSRKSRSVIPMTIADDFKEYKDKIEMFYEDKMPVIPSVPAKKKGKKEFKPAVDPTLAYILNKANKKEEKKEKDYGF